MTPVRVAIFASGTGSNAMALIHKAREYTRELEICFVLSDKATAPVLEKARVAGVRTHLVEKKGDRASHEQMILNLIQEYRIDWICLAGYMRLLSPSFLKQVSEWHSGASQVVNIHPSLLPAYPGVDSIARAYNDGVPLTGVSIHLVDEGMDTGLILAQESLAISKDEPLEAFTQRVHQLEHRMYTSFLEDLADGRRKTVPFMGE